MQTPSQRIEVFRGANVLVHTDRFGNDRVSYWCRSGTGEIMFSDRHGGATALPREGSDWVPISASLPMNVAPRAGLESGVIQTLDQMFDFFHKDARVLC